MASRGQTSTHAQQPVHAASITSGRRGAGRSAPVGQVTMHIPQAVHPGPTCTGAVAGAGGCDRQVRTGAASEASIGGDP